MAKSTFEEYQQAIKIIDVTAQWWKDRCQAEFDEPVEEWERRCSPNQWYPDVMNEPHSLIKEFISRGQPVHVKHVGKIINARRVLTPPQM